MQDAPAPVLYGCQGTALAVHFVTVKTSHLKSQVEGSVAKDRLSGAEWHEILKARGSVRVSVADGR